MGFSVSVSYNAGLRRFILMTGHTEVPKGNLGIFEGPEPWGPWKTVLYLNDTEGKQFGADDVEPNTFCSEHVQPELAESGWGGIHLGVPVG